MMHLSGQLKLIVRLALYTGMRRGELLTLTWQQVSFERRSIAVTNTKTGKPRTLHMSGAVRDLLLEAEASAAPGSAFLFPGPRKPGQPISPHTVWSAFQVATERAGIEGLRFHDLRHTAATRMAEAGAHMVDIKAVLGHSSINMTARYAHATQDGSSRALEAITQAPATVRRIDRKEAVGG